MNSANAIVIKQEPVYASPMPHWNEDPSSGPNPLVRPSTMTSTQAKYYRDGMNDNEAYVTPKTFFAQMADLEEAEDSDSDS